MISGIFSIVVCIIAALLSYAFGLCQHRLVTKREKKVERFEKLYAPFVKMIWLNTHGAFCFSDLNVNLQRDFFELLFNNYEYADSELKELLMQFKWSYDNSNLDEANQYFFLIEQRISNVFNLLSKQLFLEPYSFKYADKISKNRDKLL